jgi:hypothetical protein
MVRSRRIGERRDLRRRDTAREQIEREQSGAAPSTIGDDQMRGVRKGTLEALRP